MSAITDGPWLIGRDEEAEGGTDMEEGAKLRFQLKVGLEQSTSFIAF